MTPEDHRAALEARLGEPITLDALSGAWHILQRKHGHRHSTDDVLTAYYAWVHGPKVDHALDLGTGIGTVGLLVLHVLGPEARLTCVEAQEISFTLLRANLALTVEERLIALEETIRFAESVRRVERASPSEPTSADAPSRVDE